MIYDGKKAKHPRTFKVIHVFTTYSEYYLEMQPLIASFLDIWFLYVALTYPGSIWRSSEEASEAQSARRHLLLWAAEALEIGSQWNQA